MSQSNQLILFARAPVYGAVKQRLAKDIGKQSALEFYQDTLASLIKRLQPGPWEICVSVASEGDEQHPLFQHLQTTVQPDGDLGFRMQRGLGDFAGVNRIIIGSDVPTIQPSHLHKAFEALCTHDMVFGPATDGGFWLVGCAKAFNPISPFMENVRWSSAEALSDTRATLPEDVKVAEVVTLSDIDDGEAYHKFMCSANSPET